MSVFKLFFKIAKKRFVSASIYLGIFLILIVIMSMNSSNTDEKNFQASSLNLCIIDQDNSHASQTLTDYLSKSHNIVDLNSKDKNVLQDNLYYQNIDYVLTINKGFERNLLDGNMDNLLSHSQLFDSVSGYFAGQQIDEFITTLNLYLIGGYNMDEALSKTSSALLKTDEPDMVDFENRNKETSSGDIFYYFQYVPYIMISMLLVGLTPILITFRKKDINSRINCSSLTLRSRNIQITLGCIVYGLALWLVFIIIGGCFGGFHILFSEKGMLCILNSLIFLGICVAITLFISTFSLSDNILNMIANVIGLGMSFLCGIFVPQWYLGDGVLSISRFLPAYWYVKANNMLSGFSGETMSYSNFYKYIGIQAIFFAAIFGIYLVASKQRKIKG